MRSRLDREATKPSRRVVSDLRRLIDLIPPGTLRETVLDTLALVSRLLHQAPRGGGKIYALHESDVDYIYKDKARIRYEFGTKVRTATTIKRLCRWHARVARQPL